MPEQVPYVSYLVIDDDEPHLRANRCDGCGALFLDRRNACAQCGQRSFSPHRLSDEGTVRAFTIVHRAPHWVKTPFVSAVVDLDGGGVVKANVVGVEPDPRAVSFGMRVRMTTFTADVDDRGTEAITFAYEPA